MCDRFLLAALQIEVLASGHIINPHTLRQAVEQLPVTLNDLYEATLHRISQQAIEEQELALQALLWITHTTRPLKIEELLEALTVDISSQIVDAEKQTSQETLISVCLGLIAVEKESGLIRLIRKSINIENLLTDEI